MEELLDTSNSDQDKKWARKRNLKDLLITFIFFGGGCLTPLTYYIFKTTLIDWWILPIIWIGVGIACIPLSKNHILDFYKETSLFHLRSFSIIGLGGLILFILMSMNRFISIETKERTLDVPIISKG